MSKQNHNQSSAGTGTRIVMGVLKFFALLIETVLLIALGLYAVMFVLCKGPSESARDLFVMSVRETSAIGFLADMFFTEDEIAAIEAKSDDVYIPPTDTSLVTIAAKDPEQTVETGGKPAADQWGFVDDDGDGIILEEVHGSGYSGYMMIVLDPSRVIMGCVPSSFGARGYTVAEMVEYYHAVAGINAGGFYDPNGQGNGSIPDSLVVFDGKIYYAELGVGNGFVGFDSNNILHVGKMSKQQIIDADIQYGVCFGPALVVNGEMADQSTLVSGVNPRTAIGQRSDGAVLLLVIDGRQVISMGATYLDIAEIMLRYGAVNACNLDGGSSSLMWFGGDYINNCASVIGIRPVPDTFIVLAKED